MSLIELVATLAIMGIVLGTTTSTLGLMTRTGSRLQTDAKTRAGASLAIFRMRNELRLAKALLGSTGQSIRFVHPDITDDDVDDTIEYRWSGTSGDPIERTLNDVDAFILIDRCLGFSLTLDAEIEMPAIEGDPIVSGILHAVRLHLEVETSAAPILLDGSTLCMNEPDLEGFLVDDLPLTTP